MQHDDKSAIQKTNEILRDLPLLDRVAALLCSLIHEEPRAPEAIIVALEALMILTRNLPPSQQTAVAWHLQSAIEELRTTRWN